MRKHGPDQWPRRPPFGLVVALGSAGWLADRITRSNTAVGPTFFSARFGGRLFIYELAEFAILSNMESTSLLVFKSLLSKHCCSTFDLRE